MNSDIRPFTIDVPDAVLDDLRRRLRETRWPEAETVDDWSQGTPLSYARDLAEYWAESYNWRDRESKLNRFDQFVTEIDGLDIHFVHQRSPHDDAMPLILSHGWPGSIVEFHKVIEPLTDPTRFGGDASDAFHVIAPSLPGFGFSDKPSTTGWGVEKIGETFATLMSRLGYDRYVAQGGDWGSAITHSIGALDSDHCAAIHMTLAMGARPTDLDDPSPEELHALERAGFYAEWDSGYSKQQSTRPQSVGYGLVDSPAAQAAWIVEKFWAWTDNDGHPEDVLTRDELLDNVMFYWVSGSGASSARLYWESFGKRRPLGVGDIPTGFASFPREVVPPVRSWVEPMYPGLCHWAEYDKGGHFAAFEVPDTFVDEVRMFFRSIRS
jgi:pimeloyl-ACP methyl ester carboxylesterase